MFLPLISHGATTETKKIFLPGATGSGPYDVANAWATAFEAKYPEAHVTLSSVGSGAAQKALWGDIDCENKPIDALCDESVWGTTPEGETSEETVWGLGDAPIQSSIYEDHPEPQLQQFPACSGAVAVVYSNEVIGEDSTEPLQLTFELISGIFNQSIVYWDDPFLQAANPHLDLPHETISVVVRSDSSGQSSIITDALGYNVESWPLEAVGKLPSWPLRELSNPSARLDFCSDLHHEDVITENNITIHVDPAELPTSFSADGKAGVSLGMLRVPYSIGYMEIGSVGRLSDFLSLAEIGQDGNFVPPDADSLRSTMDGLSDGLHPDTLELNLARADTPLGGYPIAGYAYWYVKKNHTAYDDCYQAWLMCKFVEWSYTDPQAAELALAHDWVVPPESVVRVALEKLNDVMCRKTENGQSVVIRALDYTPPPYRVQQSIDVTMVSTITAAAFVVLVVILIHVVTKRRMKGDHIWKVNKKELHFDDPPQIIGRGSFGLVLLAEYRGTNVAVKRAIPPRSLGSRNRKSKFGSVGNRFFDTNNQNHGITSVETGGMSSGNDSVVHSSALSNEKLLSMLRGHALKNKSSSKQLSRNMFIEEMRILSKLRHPCITTVMGAVLNMTEEPMLIMEHMEHGSLWDILQNDTMVLDDELLIPMIQDIAQGLRFLHSNLPQVIHGDLKSKNVLVDRKFRAKVADFGLSKYGSSRNVCGTPYFMAPELLSGKSGNTAPSDVYAFGMLLYEAFSRKDPYDGEVPSSVLFAVMESNKRPPVPSNMPESIAAIMKECLQADPSLRPTAQELDDRLKRIQKDTTTGENKPLKPKNSNISLFDVFPRHIAEALRDGRTIEPEHKDCITLFFSDIVGFTDISSKLEPHKVASLLDRLYNIFDDLSAKYEVFKVETIGDAYMACTNLVKEQPEDHAARIAKFAIAVVDASKETLIDIDDPDMGYVNLRAGFHSGPVVADVVGNRNPRYCLFGDTVNTASRMESTSEKNRIQCSKTSFELLKKQIPELHLKPRGSIPVKGKGYMKTYWVNETMKGEERFNARQDATVQYDDWNLENEIHTDRSSSDYSDYPELSNSYPDLDDSPTTNPISAMKVWTKKRGLPVPPDTLEDVV